MFSCLDSPASHGSFPMDELIVYLFVSHIQGGIFQSD